MIHPHLWTVMCLSTAVSAVTVVYPRIGGSETLTCQCPDHQCQRVYWYRILHGNDTPQFLVFCNSANYVNYGAGFNDTRFKAQAQEGSRIIYSLRITGLRKDEAGFYSCVLSSQKLSSPEDLLPPGYYIRPGEHPPTMPPPIKTTKPTKPQLCKSNHQPSKGCSTSVLWPGVGVLLALAMTLISTLYYYSRLPKKCRHNFAKRMQL
ncbi:uncharacterized protein cd8b [Brachyhypopomus gauderio]|uniref:uncharacterized protein cd8b n=1 Tax=Brachyhypopomus gauderio TaxID=698409 RepID=UPI004040EF0A